MTRPSPGNKSPGMKMLPSSKLGMVALTLGVPFVEVRTTLPDLGDIRPVVATYLSKRQRINTSKIARPGVGTLGIKWPSRAEITKMVVRGMNILMMEIRCSEGPDTWTRVRSDLG